MTDYAHLELHPPEDPRIAFLNARIEHYHHCRECNEAGWAGACGWDDPVPYVVPQPGASGCYSEALVLLLVWTPLAAVVAGVVYLLRRLLK